MSGAAAELVERVWEDPSNPGIQDEVRRRISDFDPGKHASRDLACLLLARAHLAIKVEHDFRTAELVIDRGLSIDKNEVDEEIWVRLLNYAGFVFSATGRFGDAAQPLIAALRSAREQNNVREAVRAGSNLAEILLDLGKPDDALRILEIADLDVPSDPRAAVELRCLHARILMEHPTHEGTLDAIRRVREIPAARRDLSPREEGIIWSTLAQGSRLDPGLEPTRELAQRALDIAWHELEPRNRVTLLDTITCIALDEEDIPAAIDTGERLAEELAEVPTMAEIRALGTLARVQLAVGKPSQAERFSQRAQDLSWEQARSDGARLIHILANRYAEELDVRSEDPGSGFEALRRTQRELERARGLADRTARRLQAITDAVPIHIAHVEDNGVIAFVNSKLLLDFELDEFDVLGVPVNAVFGRPEWQPILQGLNRALLGEESTIGHQIELANGPRELEVTWLPAASGRGAYLVSRDVTEQRERERLEQQLLRAQKAESLGVLASGIAHDFNNLLTSMLANLSLVDDDPDHPESSEAIHDAIEATRRAASLTKQLLDYTGKVRNQLVPTSVNELVESTCSMMQSTIRGQATVCFDLSEQTPYARVDSDQIGRVVMNLLMNACESSRDQRNIITVRTGTLAHQGGSLEKSHPDAPLGQGAYTWIEVADNGSGMSEETIRRVFDPFYTTKKTGRGLGLAASLGIVKAHRGRMLVESTRDLGTTIRVVLPACEPAILTPQKPPSASLDVRRVLLIDDDDSVRTAVRRTLTSLDLECVDAADGPAGLELLHENGPFDLVLLDLTMAKMDGSEVLRRIRAQSDVQIVLISGYSRYGAQALLEHGGADEFLQKPVSREDLIELLSSRIPDRNSPHVES
ncbi:MAG: response regulator [Planctomycetota bacterium]